jgi:hypothetical protein
MQTCRVTCTDDIFGKRNAHPHPGDSARPGENDHLPVDGPAYIDWRGTAEVTIEPIVQARRLRDDSPLRRE